MLKITVLNTVACSILLMVLSNVVQAQQQNRPVTPTAVSPNVNTVPGPYGAGVAINYVRTWDAMGPITDPNVIISSGYLDVKQTTDYMDGLGRPLQTVSRQATRNGKDFVKPVVYDAFDREAYQYLPYVSADVNGLFKTDPFNEQKAFMQTQYADEQVYYQQINYEASPINRTLKTMPAGNSWAGSNKGVNRDYMVNAADDGVRFWNIASDPLTYNNKDVTTNIPTTAVPYNAGTLYKTIITDEAGNISIEFKNKEGQIVLKKVSGDAGSYLPSGLQSDLILTGVKSGLYQAYNSISLIDDFQSSGNFTAELVNGGGGSPGYTGFACTYYIYDDLNQLRFVIPPKAVAQLVTNNWQLTPDIINELCFRYEYDSRNRMIAKKVPGADWAYMVYDVRDRLVFTQDANLRKNGQWMATMYDGLDRQVMTGIMNWNDGNPDVLQQNVMSQTANGGEASLDGVLINKSPLPTGAVFTALTKVYYDNYSWTNKAYSAAYNNYLDGGNNLHAVTMPSQADQQTTGMITGKKIRVIVDPGNLAAGSWLTTVNFYDDRGRLLQTNQETQKGTYINTNRYDFTGKVISSYLDHTNATGSPATVHIKTNFEYNHAGQLLQIWKTINDDANKKTLVAENDYDELGQLTNKKLGRKKDAAGNYTIDPVETLTYNYNIRGWLTGINKDYANGTGNNWFGMELNYDKGFQINQYNGNLAGAKWRSKGDGERRAYGYSYDKQNRLLGADFTQVAGSNYSDNNIINFDMVMGDGINSLTAYDENGNIRAMKQWGLKLNNSPVIDDLRYSYFNNGNKLSAVTDNAPVTTGASLGDFTDKNTSGDDYGYDGNGNLITDRNKGLIGNTGIDMAGGAITYNCLNLPWQEAVKKDDGVTDKGTISYVYDAGGTKLTKIVIDKSVSGKTITTTTNYIGSLVYESKATVPANTPDDDYTDRLQFLGHEEGRIRYVLADDIIPAHFEFDYFIRDHLGNVRMVLTEEQKTNIYQAGLEDGKRSFEATLFGNKINTTYTDKPGGFDGDNTNQKVSAVNGTTAEGGVGPGVILKVMAGDKITAQTFAWYQNSSMDNSTDPGLTAILTNLLGQLVPGISGIAHGTVTEQVTNSMVQPGMENFLGTQNPASGAPRAYLNWVLLDDEQFKMVAGGVTPVPQITGSQQKQLLQANGGNPIEMTKNGYLYVYVSNESKGDVYFDDIRVDHIRDALMEETHYYPFGLTMAGISSKRINTIENKKKFNGIEQTMELDLNQYDATYRTLDPQLGRFWQIDPLGEMRDSWSPYQFGSDNPTLRVDPLGLKDTVVNGEHGSVSPTMAPVTVVGYKPQSAGASAQGSLAGLGMGFGFQGGGPGQSTIIDPFNWGTLNYTPVPKDYKRDGLPGFPGTGKGFKHPESKRWRWYTPDGKILEWDSEKGEVEKYDKSGRPGTHHGGFDPRTGGQTSPKVDKRWTYPTTSTTLNTVTNSAVVVTAGVILWEVAKWGIAIVTAPETLGGSLALAAAAP